MATVQDLRTGADVYSSDGHKLGELSRIVLRRSDLAATHIVVDIGFLRAGHRLWEGGLGLEYDRVIPMEAVLRATEDRIELNLTAEEFRDTPEYTIESFETVDYEGSEYEPRDIADRLGDLLERAGEPGTFLIQRLNAPGGSVDIREGSPVWRQQPHEKLGEVDRVMFDSAGKATAFVVRRGLILKRDLVFPVRYVSELLDDLVRVEISDRDLDALREFQEQ